jgi:hypothetical protein
MWGGEQTTFTTLQFQLEHHELGFSSRCAQLKDLWPSNWNQRIYKKYVLFFKIKNYQLLHPILYLRDILLFRLIGNLMYLYNV